MILRMFQKCYVFTLAFSLFFATSTLLYSAEEPSMNNERTMAIAKRFFIDLKKNIDWGSIDPVFGLELFNSLSEYDIILTDQKYSIHERFEQIDRKLNVLIEEWPAHIQFTYRGRSRPLTIHELFESLKIKNDQSESQASPATSSSTATMPAASSVAASSSSSPESSLTTIYFLSTPKKLAQEEAILNSLLEILTQRDINPIRSPERKKIYYYLEKAVYHILKNEMKAALEMLDDHALCLAHFYDIKNGASFVSQIHKAMRGLPQATSQDELQKIIQAEIQASQALEASSATQPAASSFLAVPIPTYASSTSRKSIQADAIARSLQEILSNEHITYLIGPDVSEGPIKINYQRIYASLEKALHIVRKGETQHGLPT